MNLYATSAPINEGVGKVCLFPHDDKFLVIGTHLSEIQSVAILNQSELSEINSECHYFDVGTAFNLLPKISDELINEGALQEFLNWMPNTKIYHRPDNTNNLEIQFQITPVAGYSVSHAIPAVHKHHIIEMMLATSQNEGITALIYQHHIFVAVFVNGQPKLCNLFNAKTDEEIMYYILLVIQELNLPQEEVKLDFYGAFPEKPENTEKYLSSYIRNFSIKTFDKVKHPYQGITQLVSAYHENY